MARPLAGIVPARYIQGVDLTQAVSAAGGMVFTAWGSRQVVKDTSTTMGKVFMLGAGVGMAIIAGMGAKALNPAAAKAAVLGGLAGVTLNAVAMFTDIELGGSRTKLIGGGARRLGTADVVSPAFTRENETVSIITP